MDTLPQKYFGKQKGVWMSEAWRDDFEKYVHPVIPLRVSFEGNDVVEPSVDVVDTSLRAACLDEGIDWGDCR
jgi:hypothetical protein